MTNRPPGQVFTPPALADRLVALGLDALGAALDDARRDDPVRVVEPSAGDGALLAALDRAQRNANTPRLDVTAVELDAALVDAARDAHPNARVVHADGLSLGLGTTADAPFAAPFGADSPASYLFANARLAERGWADLVVANPPYLRETGNADVFRAIRTGYEGVYAALYRKDTDLHVFFWALAMRLLRPGGALAFLTPAYFLDATSAQPLRDALAAQGEVLSVWRAGSDAAFPGVGVEAAVTVWRKHGERRTSQGRTASVRQTAYVGGLPQPGAPSHRVSLPDAGPWWLSDASTLSALQTNTTPLGALYRVVEGVSTGANRVRARDAERVGAPPRTGILVLDEAEYHALSACPDVRRFARPRLGSAQAAPQWILRLRDGDLPRLDAGEAPQSALEHHLTRFRPILSARAEMRRNPARSWYACAWPRPELDAPGAIVTPKWSKTPAFAPLDARVPMTDMRILLPRTEVTAAQRDAVLSWLHSAEVAPWYAARLKRKGEMLEWYGEALAAIPIRLG